MLLTIPFFVASVTYTIYHYVITYHFILNVGVRGGETSIFFYNCCGYFCSCYLIYHVQESPITMLIHLTFVIYIVFQDLAGAGATKRPTCCVLVQTKPAKGEIEQGEQEKLKSDYDQVVSEVTELTTSLF